MRFEVERNGLVFRARGVSYEAFTRLMETAERALATWDAVERNKTTRVLSKVKA